MRGGKNMIKKGKNGERYFEKQYEARNERFLKHEKYSEKIYKVHSKFQFVVMNAKKHRL